MSRSKTSREAGQATLPFGITSEPKPASLPRRVFLGWKRPALEVAVDWILEQLGQDLGNVVIALPGSRAVRRLHELLARSASPCWTPPRICTQGELSDELVRLEHPVAGRLARTLAWDRALRDLPLEDLARLVRLPATDGADERLRLAETARALHGELAPEGLDFEHLAHGAASSLEPEAARWAALTKAQRRYRSILCELGLEDPHEGRMRAIAAGRIDAERRVVLVGVADMNHLLVRLLERNPERVTVLIVAPPDEADGFDELGRMRTAAWKDRIVPLALEYWRVAEKPVDQADVASRVIGGWNERFAAAEVAIGVPNEEVVPYLERRLFEAGAKARNAAGTPVERTPPVRLLRAVGRYLASRGFSELSALARDADLGPVLVRDGDPASALDGYYIQHLPCIANGEWLGEDHHASGVRTFHARLEERLGALAGERVQPLTFWSGAIRAFLVSVYDRALEVGAEPDRVRAETLRIVGGALGELEEVPRALAERDVRACEAIELLLGALSGERVPPPPTAEDGEVELLGWLELPLDDAPALVVTGFEEGRVPRSIGEHAFLPDQARRRLGLPNDDDRLARDVYAATVLLASREKCVFITGRRSTVGDPLVPSRLAFQRPEEEIVERVKRFLPEDDGAERSSASYAEPDRSSASHEDDDETVLERPILADRKPPDSMSVSSFRTYLDSPYLFYLKCVEKLSTLDDRVRELDPLRFGILAHEVLQVFGQDGPRESLDARELEQFLRRTLGGLVREQFGTTSLPAVHIQVEQLQHRLALFARKEAERRREGWRIHAVEWEAPPEAAWLEVDGMPMRITGRIDRIDAHADGRWAIIDYKTGDNPRIPDKAHRFRGRWVDLQLPLYRHLVRGFELQGEPALGYCSIGKEGEDIRFDFASWTAQELEEALDAARDVVRRVRAGDFQQTGRTPYEPIFRAMINEGMATAERGEDT